MIILLNNKHLKFNNCLFKTKSKFEQQQKKTLNQILINIT